MALLVGGEVDAARRAPTTGCLATQRDDGSWPMKIVGGVVEDASGETNMSAYLAVGVWHHWLVRRDAAFVRRLLAGRAARRSTSWSRLQLPFGGIAWSQEWTTGRHGQRGGAAGRLVEHLPGAARRRRAGRAARRPAARVGARRPAGSGTRCASTATCSWTSRRSRWTGTTRCSAAPSAATAGRDLLDEPLGRLRGARASASAASTPTRGSPAPRPASWCWRSTRSATASARCALFADMQHLRARRTARYWTGYVYPDERASGRPSTRRTPPRR